MTTPRGLTQPYTSFIGSACQGIHHAPLVTNTQPTTTNPHTSRKLTIAGVNNKTQKNKRNYTTQQTNHTKCSPTVRCVMLASTIQFSHNTPTNQQPASPDATCYLDWVTPGDNAPDTQQCTNAQKIFAHKMFHTVKACSSCDVSPPDSKNVGSTTLGHSTNHQRNTVSTTIPLVYPQLWAQ